MCGTITPARQVDSNARHAARPPGAAVRFPPLADAQGNDVTARWPLRSFLELGALPSAVPCARLHTRHLLWEWHLTSLQDSAELMVSEIVTNAIQITQADGRTDPVRLWLLADRKRLVILVQDASPLPPAPMSTSGDAENGRGLLLVDTLSARWGHFLHPSGGKVVWSLIEALLQQSKNSADYAMLGRRSSRGAVCHDTTGRIVGDLERRFHLLMTENTPEVAYYYPATFWAARENGWIKSLLLFFDQVSILLPAYMYGRHKMADPALSGPLEDQGLLRILDPKTWVDQAMAEKVASTVIDLLAAGVFDDLPRAHHFAELSKSRIGYSADISLASWLVDELEQKGLARPPEDGVSIPLHPVVRTAILVLLAQLARLHGIDEGLSINPTTNMAPAVGDLLRLLSHENLPSAANIVTLDLEPITLDLETVPLDEVLDYRKENQSAHQAYMRDVRRFALDLACTDDASREALLQKRRVELSEAIRELKTTARRAFGKNLAAWSFGLAGSWWSLKHGDPIGLTLAALPALTAATPESQIVGAYSYLFEAQHEFG